MVMDVICGGSRGFEPKREPDGKVAMPARGRSWSFEDTGILPTLELGDEVNFSFGEIGRRSEQTSVCVSKGGLINFPA